ncbi:hypothetical protein CTAYLR_003099 [Chrysophaeum taylorii]|uniref:VWFA domain-containing protein n=1 Tax=Chrysophaeum taylorii TaxID=2483200 RepID=A0AAD7XGP9_9STRA|nr:hypothetical protein CTAYLR_003099 [Chrysophaeum taylorii]
MDCVVEDSLQARVEAMKQRLRLPEEHIKDLLSISGGTDIVVIADDSSSMNMVADTEGLRTRWIELQETLRSLVTMLLVIEHVDGFWLKFLNDPSWYIVTSEQQLVDIYLAKPRARGKTPLKASLAPVMQGYGDIEKETLVLTDGQPTDCSFPELVELVRSKRSDVYLSFAMCTDQLDVVDAYNKLVDPIPGCDITDDYVTERAEAKLVGRDLTPYQWLVKLLLVKHDHYDKLDEHHNPP